MKTKTKLKIALFVVVIILLRIGYNIDMEEFKRDYAKFNDANINGIIVMVESGSRTGFCFLRVNGDTNTYCFSPIIAGEPKKNIMFDVAELGDSVIKEINSKDIHIKKKNGESYIFNFSEYK